MREYEISENANREIIAEVSEFICSNWLYIHDLGSYNFFNENWFTNTLAWLLRAGETHAFAVQFIKEFIMRIAELRTNDWDTYSHSDSMFKIGNRQPGQTPYNIAHTASIPCQYNVIGEKRLIHDIVINNPKHKVFVIIEVKLFQKNSKDQLPGYYRAGQKHYEDYRIKEYVYLTINGDQPKVYSSENKDEYRNWVRMSWREDILRILDKMPKNKHNADNERIDDFRKILKWIDAVEKDNRIKSYFLKFQELIVKAISESLVVELNRYTYKYKNERSWVLTEGVIEHTTNKKLHVTFKSRRNFVVEITFAKEQEEKNKRFIQMIVPSPFEVYPILERFAFEIVRYMFGQSSVKSDDNAPEDRTIAEIESNKHYGFFWFCNDYRGQLWALEKYLSHRL